MISIIVTVYNVEDYLHVCLNSVLEQDYNDVEVICVDDASTDSSADILEYFEKKDYRVKVIKNNNHKGISSSRNIGINSSNGEYILFLNGDDWLSLDALKILVNETEKRDFDILLFKNMIFYEESQNFEIDSVFDFNFIDKFRGKVFNHWDWDKSMLFNISKYCCGCLYSKSFLDDRNVRFINENYVYGEIPFYFNAIISANRIYFVDNYLHNRHIIPNYVIKFNCGSLFDVFPIIYSLLNIFLENREIYEYYKKQFLSYIFEDILNHQFQLIENQYKEEFFFEIQCVYKSFIKEYELYFDILENVDENILRYFKFDEIVNDLLINHNNLVEDIEINNSKNLKTDVLDKNEIFALWIPDGGETELPLLAFLSLKSMILCGHDVVLYTYQYLDNIPKGVKIEDANEIIDSSKIFRYKSDHKTYSGFANLFRLKRLYEFGGTWLDLDIILIRNINEKFSDGIIIVSEPTKQFYLHPNNALLRFPKHDPFVKTMLDFAEERGDNVVHGETGPRLVSKLLKTSFKEYNSYLKHFNFNNILKWNDINDYSKSPDELLNNVNMDEVAGFHLFNTFFKKIIDSFDSNSMFGILKEIILNSETSDDYRFYLKKYNILKSPEYNLVKNRDLRYLYLLENNENYTYSLLIDAKNLKKVEIYNILHSIGVDSSFTLQIFVFSKSSLPNDKVKFADNFNVFASNFDEISHELMSYIAGDYIIPINKALMFDLDFFKNKEISHDVEHYVLNNPGSYLNIFSKDSFKILIDEGVEDIFNLSSVLMSDFNFKVETITDNLIFDYYNREDNADKLMNLIDYLTDNPIMFSHVKTKLLDLKFKNLIDEVSYYYYVAYNNVISSNSYIEFKLKEDECDLDFLNSFYLNKLDNNYEI